MRLPLDFSDFSLAVRLMRKQPLLTTAAAFALATGIGVATVGFTFLESVLTARLPFAGGDRFVLLEARQEPDATRVPIDRARFLAFRDGVPAFRHLGAAQAAPLNLELSSGDTVAVGATAMTPASFEVLPWPPLVGRLPGPMDASPGRSAVVLLHERLWRRHFSADPSVVGRTIRLSGVPRTVIGVAPDSLEFPNSPDVWIPLIENSGQPSDASSWNNPYVFGVLNIAGTEALASAQLTAISRQLDGAPAAHAVRVDAVPFVEALSRGIDVLAGVLVAALVLMLLVIAASVANLVLARTQARATELAVRAALGATRARLVSQVFVEALAIGGIAAAVGLAAAVMTLRWIRALFTDMPFWVTLSVSPMTVMFVTAAALLSAAVCGILPALRVTRRAMPLGTAGANRAVTLGFGTAASLMIAVQITLSIALLHAAFVIARGVQGYREGGLASAPAGIVTARIVMGRDRDVRTVTLTALDALRQLDGVTAAGLGSSLPRLSPSMVMTSVRTAGDQRESIARAAPVVSASPGFLETLGATAVAGRLFTATDLASNAPPVAIVNAPFVQRFFGGANPIGAHLRMVDAASTTPASPWREIVGVVPDLGLSAGDPDRAAGYYVPIADESLYYLAVASRRETAALAAPVRAALARVDPTLIVIDILPLESVGAEDRAVFAGIATALTSLGGVTLLLSVMGVYAMLSFAVTSRTREIGLRSALGATTRHILKTVFAGAWKPLAIGAMAGPLLGEALVAARVIFAFRLPADSGPWGWPVLITLMIAAGLTAAWIPARRALAITTSEALRAE
jgi:putative ABC transport system permease protein